MTISCKQKQQNVLAGLGTVSDSGACGFGGSDPRQTRDRCLRCCCGCLGSRALCYATLFFGLPSLQEAYTM
jgi:hypothetical protein